jgi:hypothetical protein
MSSGKAISNACALRAIAALFLAIAELRKSVEVLKRQHS